MYNILDIIPDIKLICSVNVDIIKTLSVICIILLTTFLFIWLTEKTDNLFFAFLAIVSFFSLLPFIMTLDSSCDNYLENNVVISTKQEKKEVSFLPNQVMTTDVNKFIIDNEEFEVIKIGKVLFYEDSTNNPYIIVDKLHIELKEDENPFIDKSSLKCFDTHEELKNIYVLKEVHY